MALLGAYCGARRPRVTCGDAGGPAYRPQRLPRPQVPAVKLSYYPDTDTLYIALSTRLSVESDEVAKNVVLDLDENGLVTGIEIEHASERADLREVALSLLPVTAA